MKKTLILFMFFSITFLAGCNQKEETYKLGFIGTLSGQYAEVALAEMYGVQLAVSEINADGGFNGQKIELLVRDDEADSLLAVEMQNELKEEGVNVIIGHSLSIVASDAVKNANENDILLLSPSFGTDLLTGIDDNLIRNVATVRYEGQFISEKIIENNPEKVLMIHDLDNVVLTSYHVEAFEESFENAGFDASDYTVKGFTPDNVTDQTDIETMLSSGMYDTLFIAASNNDSAIYVNYIKSNNIECDVHLTSWASTGLINSIESKNTSNIFAYINFDVYNTTNSFLVFSKSYHDTYGKEPNMVAVNAYDFVYILRDAIDEVGSEDIDLIKNYIIDSDIVGINSNYRIDQYGDNVREHIQLVIEDGEYVKSEE